MLARHNGQCFITASAGVRALERSVPIIHHPPLSLQRRVTGEMTGDNTITTTDSLAPDSRPCFPFLTQVMIMLCQRVVAVLAFSPPQLRPGLPQPLSEPLPEPLPGPLCLAPRHRIITQRSCCGILTHSPPYLLGRRCCLVN